MSNMMFCCSIFYKMKLPIIVVINKADVYFTNNFNTKYYQCADADKLIEWMQDYEKFEVAN